MWKPNVPQMSTGIRVQHRIVTEDDINYIAENEINFCNWKGMGGTTNIDNGVLAIQDTANLTMWYDPEIKELDRILLNDDKDLVYIIQNVENVEQRNMFLILKVKRAVSI